MANFYRALMNAVPEAWFNFYLGINKEQAATMRAGTILVS